MFAPAAIQQLSGERLHLSHGPIDVVLKAWGKHKPRAPPMRLPASDSRRSCRSWRRAGRACGRRSRSDARSTGPCAADGRGCLPFAEVFVTPMAAVAAAVADELLAYMTAAAELSAPSSTTVATSPCWSRPVMGWMSASRRALPRRNAGHQRQRPPRCGVEHRWHRHIGRGRALLLARPSPDSATILARDAATADVAATLVANAVDVDSPAVRRRPARELDPDSDLRDLLVTVSVGPPRPRRDRHSPGPRALERALAYRRRRLIADAALMLQATAARSAIGPAAPAQPYLCPRNFSTSSRVG